MITQEAYEAIIRDRFQGRLSSGSHQPDSVACALEAYAIGIAHAWTDDPVSLKIPDIRPLNDGPWSSDAARTAAMIPLVVAVSQWEAWSETRRQVWVTRLVLQTVRELIAELPGLPDSIRSQCHTAIDLSGAESAAESAWVAAVAAGAAWSTRAAAESAWVAAVGGGVVGGEVGRSTRAAAESAAESAWAAAGSAAGVWSGGVGAQTTAELARVVARAMVEARAAAGDRILARACQIWIEAATSLDAKGG